MSQTELVQTDDGWAIKNGPMVVHLGPVMWHKVATGIIEWANLSDSERNTTKLEVGKKVVTVSAKQVVVFGEPTVVIETEPAQLLNWAEGLKWDFRSLSYKGGQS